MIRSIEFIVAAFLHMTNVGPARAATYAPTVQRLAEEHEMDPVTLISMGQTESRWTEAAVNVVGDEEYVGIFQMRLRNYPQCRTGLGSPECAELRSLLKTFVFNAEQAASAVTANRSLCRDLVGSALFRRWLMSFAGYNSGANPYRPRRGDIWCGMMWDGRRWVRAKTPRTVQETIRRRARTVKVVTAEMERQRRIRRR